LGGKIKPYIPLPPLEEKLRPPPVSSPSFGKGGYRWGRIKIRERYKKRRR